MATKGVFGYIICKKKRLMKVSDDADLLWQLATREIFLLMNKYKTKEAAMAEHLAEKYGNKPTSPFNR